MINIFHVFKTTATNNNYRTSTENDFSFLSQSSTVIAFVLTQGNHVNLFCFLNTAKPAKRQPTAQPVPAAVAQPVVAPVVPNGNLISINCHL